MFFERSTGRRPRLRTTLAVLGLVGSSLALSLPARAEYAQPDDNDPTELYVPEAGYVYNAPRPAGRLTPATGALFGTHSDEITKKQVPAPTPKNPDKTVTVLADDEDQAIYKLEQQLGRKLDINNHYTDDFGTWLTLKNAGEPVELQLQEQLDLEKNRIPLVGWACGDSLKIVAGELDAEIDAASEAFKAYPRDFYMRYCWEMDGQRPEKRSLVHRPEDFIKAWRYVYNRVVNVNGVKNVIWVWCANANGYKLKDPFTGGEIPAPQYYPGDDVVDWVSADGYNWHGSNSSNGQDDYRDFLEIYDQFMLWSRSADTARGKGASTKPIMIGEYGSQEQQDGGAKKAMWFRKAHDTVMPRPAGLAPDVDKWKGAYSDIQAMVYYDIPGKSADAEGGWAVATTAPSLEAYKEAALNPWFNQIQTLNWGPYTGGSGGTDPGTGPGTGGTTTTPTQTTNPPVTVRTPSGKNGYWMLGQDGKVYAFGQSKHLGAPALPAGVSAADLEVSPSGNGYWIIDSAGNVSGYGDAPALGGIPGGSLAPGETVTSLSATPTGQGYWIFTSKGRAVRFGDATFFGDVSKVTLAGPVLDSIPTASGQGYYMVASDGGIFAFGDAIFHGSMGGTKLNKPVQSLVPDPDGTGYWLVASDGGIFAFKSDFKGSLGSTKLNKPITGMVPYGDGYMMVGEDGGIFNFSNKPFDGSLGASPPARPIVSVSVLP
jgi:ribosomal protein L24E